MFSKHSLKYYNITKSLMFLILLVLALTCTLTTLCYYLNFTSIILMTPFSGVGMDPSLPLWIILQATDSFSAVSGYHNPFRHFDHVVGTYGSRYYEWTSSSFVETYEISGLFVGGIVRQDLASEGCLTTLKPPNMFYNLLISAYRALYK